MSRATLNDDSNDILAAATVDNESAETAVTVGDVINKEEVGDFTSDNR